MNLGIFVTDKCNMYCKFCGSWGGLSQKFIPFNRIKYILDEGKKYGFKNLSISGGEPFVHCDISNIIQYADQKGYWIEITTNGIGINQENITNLKNKNVNIRVSLLATEPVLFNTITGGDFYNKVIDTIRLLKSNNIRFSLGATIYNENIDHIGNLAQFAYDEGASYIRYSAVVRVFRAKEAIILKSDFYKIMIKKIVDTVINYLPYLEYKKINNLPIKQALNIITTRRCQSGSNTIMLLDTDENIIPCYMINLDKGVPFVKFQDASDFQKMSNSSFNHFKKLLPELKGKCSECAFKDVCYGGCLGAKTTMDLAPEDEQPLCIKEILEEVLQDYEEGIIQKLVYYWYYHFKKRFSGTDNTACMRRLPIWELIFKPK